MYEGINQSLNINERVHLYHALLHMHTYAHIFGVQSICTVITVCLWDSLGVNDNKLQ